MKLTDEELERLVAEAVFEVIGILTGGKHTC